MRMNDLWARERLEIRPLGGERLCIRGSVRARKCSVDGERRAPAAADGRRDGALAAGEIAADVDRRRGAVHEQGAAEGLHRRREQRKVAVLTHGEQQAIARDLDQRILTLDGSWSRPPALVRLTERHPPAHEGGAPIALAELGRRQQLLDGDAFLECLVDLLGDRRHLGARAAVHDPDFARAQPHGGTGRVHRRVAAADDHDRRPAQVRGGGALTCEKRQALLDDAGRRAGDVEGAQALLPRGHKHGGVLARHSPESGAVDP